jgi:hypothetical protein
VNPVTGTLTGELVSSAGWREWDRVDLVNFVPVKDDALVFWEKDGTFHVPEREPFIGAQVEGGKVTSSMEFDDCK